MSLTADPLPAFARVSAIRVPPTGVFAIDVFAGLLVTAAMVVASRVCQGRPDRAIAEDEAANEHAGARRNAQCRHPHAPLIPDKTVADKAFTARGLSHISRHSSVESFVAGRRLPVPTCIVGYGADVASRDHGDPGDAPSVPPPLSDIANARRPSAAEEARTIAASTNTGTLATLTATGDPWASFVAFGLLEGAPVLCVSNLAEHGRNLVNDQRASMAIVAPATDPDPLASGRATLAGVVERPSGDELGAARDAYLAAVPAAKYYVDYSDFALWVLRVQRVRWVGGYGRMDSATGKDYTAAESDPIQPRAAGAITHLNDDHATALCAMAKTLGGYPDATAATCTAADRYGLDLRVSTPRGVAYTRVGYSAPIDSFDDLRSATVELTRRATISL